MTPSASPLTHAAGVNVTLEVVDGVPQSGTSSRAPSQKADDALIDLAIWLTDFLP